MAQRRIVAIGDLNGAAGVLFDILRGTRIVDINGRWIGGRTELIQLGDLFNRGSGARDALELLLSLRAQARGAGGSVTILLGNHEVMTALRNEAYCTEGEYLSFAALGELRAWPERVHRAFRRLYREHGPTGPILPIHPRLEAWKLEHVPGRAAMRRALGPSARLGRAIRQMPIAHVSAHALFVHAGLTPGLAKLGIARLNRAARDTWRRVPRFYHALPETSLFRNSDGPLWTRRFVLDASFATGRDLLQTLALVGARRMIVGHTSTEHVRPGYHGRIATRFGTKLVCIDVGLSDDDASPRTALVIEGRSGFEWTPEGTRLIWRDET